VSDAPRYRFGPLERRGVLAGLRASQLIVLGIAAVTAVAMLRALPASIGITGALVVAALGCFVAFVPIGARTTDEWLPVLARWGIRVITGRQRFSSRQPTAGVTTAFEAQPHLPDTLKDLQILAHVVPDSGARIGVAKDARHGTYTGVLAVRGKSFALLDAPDKARRLSSWAGILSGLAREGGMVHRISWVERTVPDTGDEVGRYLRDNVAVPLNSPLARSYLEVVDDAGPVTQDHELFVSLQIHAGRAQRAVKASGGGDEGACEVVRRELTALSSALLGGEVTVEGALTPRLLSHALRSAFDPSSRASLAAMATKDPQRAGTAVQNAGPMAAETGWGSYRTDSAYHATYWIAEWPRVEADPDFLAPLLLRTEAMRTVAVVMEPVPPLRALRAVESARTSAAADEELRNRAGFVTTTRRAREQDSLAEHERELADGHAFYRFAGFITVSAASESELAAACGEIEDAAARCFLDLRRLNGEQDHGFTYTLPLCRGLK
jgi:hypothetical protein